MASITSQPAFKIMAVLLTLVGGFLMFFYTLYRMMRHPLTWFKKKDRSRIPACLLDPELGDHEYMTANGIKFHYVVKGKRTKPLMLLLHGFPAFWYSWSEQLKHFGGDYRVVAVDLRGYGDTQCPSKKTDYKLDTLTEDIAMLIQQLGYAKCTLVAHDWGGVIAWRVVFRYPELVQNFCVLNCPHPKVYAKALSSNYLQILKSWYIFMFQVPFLPEFLLSVNDYEMLKFIYCNGKSSSDVFPDDVVEAYKYTFSRPGTLTAALNYYRNMLTSRASKKKVNKKDETSNKTELKDTLEKTKIPTLIIWGEEDTALDKSMAGMHDSLVENLVVKCLPGVNHWVHNEQPDKVNEYIRTFLEDQERKEREA